MLKSKNCWATAHTLSHCLQAELEVAAAKATSSTAAAPSPSSLRLACRSLHRGGGTPWRQLQSHWEDLSDSKHQALREAAARCLDVVAAGMGILGNQHGAGGAMEESRLQAFQAVANLEDVARLLAAVEVNAMTVTDEELREIALGLYLQGAFFNHHEEPNCLQSFVGRNLVIRTCRAVAKGDELCITYFELGQLSRVRHALLLKHFHFSVPTTPEVKKRDEVLSTICGKDQQPIASCGWDSSEGVLEDGEGQAEVFVRKVHQLWSQGNYREAWTEATSGSIQLGRGHALRLALAHELMDESIARERWQDALHFARDVSSGHRQIYPAGWPVVALGLVRLAKLESYHGNVTAALRCCEEAGAAAYVWKDRPEAAEELQQIRNQCSLEAQGAATRQRSLVSEIKGYHGGYHGSAQSYLESLD